MCSRPHDEAAVHCASTKALALQETHDTVGELEELIRNIESVLPALEEPKQWYAAKEDAERVRASRTEGKSRGIGE